MSALRSGPLDTAAALTAVVSTDHGGIALFAGTTRAEPRLREVAAIEYEAHEDLAEVEIQRILDEARDRFGAIVVAEHRVGSVATGEPSVVVAVSAPHRAEAFAACRYLIDEIKDRVPIWKRMHYTDGGTEWIDGTGHRTAGQPTGRG